MTEEDAEATIKALLNHHDLLAQQIAELSLGADTARVRLGEMERELKDNTAITQEVRDLLNTFRGGFKVLGWLGTAATWVGRIAAAAMAIWGAWYAITHHGELPHKP